VAHRRQTRFVSQRRPTGWSGVVAGAFPIVPAFSKVLLATFVPNVISGVTIRRLRGSFSIISDQSAASETQNGAIGACVVGDLAVAAGVASIKDPVTDVEDDTWLWYQSFNLKNEVGEFGRMQFEIDSKAMRKVEIGNSLVFVVGNAQLAFGFQVALSVRVLSSVMGS